MEQERQEILPLNLLRFLAALSILGVHKLATLIEHHYLPQFLQVLAPFMEHGYLGVNLFFMISGFVITLSTEGKTFSQFISSRFIRLFPVFWLCVVMTSLFTIFLGRESISLERFLANLTMTPQHYGAQDFIDGVYWTLAIELNFYAFTAFLLIIKKKISFSIQHIALILSPILLYHTVIFNPYHLSLFDNLALFVFFFFGSEYAAYFLSGILFYGLYKNNKNHLVYYFTLLCCYIVALIVALDQAYPTNSPRIITLHITIFFILFLLISLKKIRNTSFTFLGKHYQAILVTLGATTYPLYLLHSKIIAILMETFRSLQINPFISLILLCCIVASLVVSVNRFDVWVRKKWKTLSLSKKINAS